MAVTGGRELKRNLRAIGKNIRAEVVDAMDDNAEDLRARSNQLAPQLTGELILSAQIRRRGNRSRIQRTVFYRSPYAVVRHEDFYNLGPISSLKTSPDGQVGRKYLSRAFNKHAQRYVDNVGRAVGRSLRGRIFRR